MLSILANDNQNKYKYMQDAICRVGTIKQSSYKNSTVILFWIAKCSKSRF